MPLKLNSSGGGSVTLDVPSTASDFTATVPANTGTLVTTGSTAAVTQGMLASGVAGNGPAFLVLGGSQTISNVTFTKINLTSETFDTANAFDTTTNRFTPQVAGYYQFNYQYSSNQTSGSLFCELRRNNVRFSLSTITAHQSGIGATASGSAFIFLNGTTDYIELFGYQNSGSSQTTDQINTLMSGFLARAA